MSWRSLALVILVFSLSLVAPVRADSGTCSLQDNGLQNFGQMVEAFQAKVDQPQPRDFNYLNYPEITRAFKPNTIYNGKEVPCEMGENETSMSRMHAKIKTKCAEYGIDPAIVYLIMLGESRGDPFIHSGGKPGARCVSNGVAPQWNGKAAYYSLFQFGSAKHKNAVDQWIKDKLGKPPADKPDEAPMGVREIVIDYYLENYLKGKKLIGLTPLQQIALLDLGNPGAATAMKNKIYSAGYTAGGARALYEDLIK